MSFFFPKAYAKRTSSTCDEPPTLILFRQSKIDINGGELNGYMFEGGNNLESVERTELRNCVVKYELTFADEDHPTIDEDYDDLREKIWKRTKDIEKFYIQSNGDVNYYDIWSNGKQYD